MGGLVYLRSIVETILTSSPDVAASLVIEGGVVAFPTETVYGLGADVFNEIAVAKIFEAKRRPADNPLIAHIGEIDQLDQLVKEIPRFVWDLIDTFFPGPLTLVLEKTERVPLVATAGLATIGVRMPAYDLTRKFLRACGTPVAAPSANLSGRPSPTTWQAVFEDLNGSIDCILQGEPTEIGLESTVVDCTSARPLILRPGAITLEQLREVVPETEANANEGEPTKSPGMKHRHYSPSAELRIIERGRDLEPHAPAAFIGLHDPGASFELKRVLSSVAEYAHEVFEFFRECDRRGIKLIFCESVPEQGVGAALMDRLRRAAQG